MIKKKSSQRDWNFEGRHHHYRPYYAGVWTISIGVFESLSLYHKLSDSFIEFFLPSILAYQWAILKTPDDRQKDPALAMRL